jgi:Ni/Fe-hydrogenase subunit HybB-like protein
LAKAIPVVLGIYAVVKFGELAIAGDMKYLFTSGLMSVLFWVEIIIGVLLPLALFSMKRIRRNGNALLISAVILLFGMILNRFNVSWLAVHHPDPLSYLPTFMGNVRYFPTLPEVLVSVGIFSFGILAFGLAAKYLPVFDTEDHHSAE